MQFSYTAVVFLATLFTFASASGTPNGVSYNPSDVPKDVETSKAKSGVCNGTKCDFGFFDEHACDQGVCGGRGAHDGAHCASLGWSKGMRRHYIVCSGHGPPGT